VRRLRWYLLLPTIPVVIAIAAAVLAPWVAPYSPTSGNLAARLRPPAWVAGGSADRLSAPICSGVICCRGSSGARASRS
jgi:hypothetical protein